MFETLSRLYRTKMLLSSVLLTVAGIGLLILGHSLDDSHSLHWLSQFPWSEFGGILIGAGLLSVWLDHFFAQDQAEMDEERLRRLLREQAPAMRDAVLDAFAANQADLERVASPETLDRIIGNSLALRLHDSQFAHEVYEDIRDQAIAAAERWENVQLSIELRPLEDTPPTRDRQATHHAGPFFVVEVRWEYTVIPRHSERRFVCVSDREEYAELASERNDTSAWFMRPENGLDVSDEGVFKLLRFTVNGEARRIGRASRRTGQTYTAHIGNEAVLAGKPVTVSYTYRTLTAQASHLLFFDIEQPARDLNVDLTYSGCGIAALSALDLVPAVRPTRIERPPEPLPQDGLRVHVEGWIFPRSGVAFVWSLQRELSQPRDERPSDRTTA